MDSTAPVGEPLVEQTGSGQEAGPAKVLGVLEHEEKVEMSDEDADELHDAAAGDDHVEGEEYPRQIHGFELGAEPKVDDDVLVELAPDVEDAEHHGVHQEGDGHEQGHDDGARPVEHQHEEVVGGPPVKDTRLQTQGVVVQEVQVDQEVETGLWSQRVEEQSGERTPKVEPC